MGGSLDQGGKMKRSRNPDATQAGPRVQVQAAEEGCSAVHQPLDHGVLVRLANPLEPVNSYKEQASEL